MEGRKKAEQMKEEERKAEEIKASQASTESTKFVTPSTYHQELVVRKISRVKQSQILSSNRQQNPWNNYAMSKNQLFDRRLMYNSTVNSLLIRKRKYTPLPAKFANQTEKAKAENNKVEGRATAKSALSLKNTSSISYAVKNVSG
jgi:hypothetical protein